jgi:hypothetical protein
MNFTFSYKSMSNVFSMDNINVWNVQIIYDFAQFPLLNCEMLSLWCFNNHYIDHDDLLLKFIL